MAKEIEGYLKLQVQGGQANPSPPVGPALGANGVNIMEFCKAFNARTQDKAGKVIPTIITVYSENNFKVSEANELWSLGVKSIFIDDPTDFNSI